MAVWPAVTAVDVPEEDPAVHEKPGGVAPVPASVTVCGLAGVVASSVIVSAPVRKPVAEGENVTLMVQFAPAATLPSQLFVSANSAAFVPLVPLAARLEITKSRCRCCSE